MRVLLRDKSMSTVYLYSRGGWDEGVSFYSISTIVENQGERTTELYLKRRKSWIAKIQEWAPIRSHLVYVLSIFIW